MLSPLLLPLLLGEWVLEPAPVRVGSSEPLLLKVVSAN